MGHAVQNLSPIAGTWVPTFAGFSADPTMTCRYIIIGKFCFFWVTATGHGTSNSTTASGKTMTLPFTSFNGTTQSISVARVTNNAVAIGPGVGIVASNSNVMTVYRDSTTSAAWTGSGNCSWSMVGVYEIA